MDNTETHEHEEHHPTGRRPMSGANWVGLVLLLAAIAFYLAFAIPEFIGIVGG
jgi:hypothetical protein